MTVSLTCSWIVSVYMGRTASKLYESSGIVKSYWIIFVDTLGVVKKINKKNPEEFTSVE